MSDEDIRVEVEGEPSSRGSQRERSLKEIEADGEGHSRANPSRTAASPGLSRARLGNQGEHRGHRGRTGG